MAKFTLEIKLTNAQMQAPSEVADALESVARRLDGARESYGVDAFEIGDKYAIRDINGNAVGSWEVV